MATESRKLVGFRPEIEKTKILTEDILERIRIDLQTSRNEEAPTILATWGSALFSVYATLLIRNFQSRKEAEISLELNMQGVRKQITAHLDALEKEGRL